MKSRQVNLKDNVVISEGLNSSFVLYVEEKAKSGKWIEIEKYYNNQKYCPSDYYNIFKRYDNEIRILNSKHQQVFSKVSAAISSFYNKEKNNYKFISIKSPQDKYLSHVLYIKDYTIFNEILSDYSKSCGGFKKFKEMPPEENLVWFKLFFNNNTRIHIAFTN